MQDSKVYVAIAGVDRSSKFSFYKDPALTEEIEKLELDTEKSYEFAAVGDSWFTRFYLSDHGFSTGGEHTSDVLIKSGSSDLRGITSGESLYLTFVDPTREKIELNFFSDRPSSYYPGLTGSFNATSPRRYPLSIELSDPEVKEGEKLVTTVYGPAENAGRKIYWTLRGVTEYAEEIDVSTGAMQGTTILDENGKAEIIHYFRVESNSKEYVYEHQRDVFKFQVYEDEAHLNALANSVTVKPVDGKRSNLLIGRWGLRQDDGSTNWISPGSVLSIPSFIDITFTFADAQLNSNYFEIDQDGLIPFGSLSADGNIQAYLAITPDNPDIRTALDLSLTKDRTYGAGPGSGMTTWFRTDKNAYDLTGGQVVTMEIRQADTHKLLFSQDVQFIEQSHEPSDLVVSSSSISEAISTGETVAILSTVDQDTDDSFTYSLVIGEGSTDNSIFAIDGNLLKINHSPDFETKSSYSIRIRTTDSRGLSLEKSFTLLVKDQGGSQPAPPSTPDLASNSDTGISESDNITIDATPSFSGTAEPGSLIKIFAGEISLGTTSADANGEWIFTVSDDSSLSDGNYLIKATALKPVLPYIQRKATPGRSQQEWGNGESFAVIKDDGSVVTWGGSGTGGSSNGLTEKIGSGVRRIFSTASAFAALKIDGSVVTWGDATQGGDSTAVADELQSGVRQLASSYGAFAAIKTDGSVITWGDTFYGADSSRVSFELASSVKEITTNYRAFAALKQDGSVVTWGNPNFRNDGGDSSSVATELSRGVIRVYSSGLAFAALKDDGSVVTWGDDRYGSDSRVVSRQISSGVSHLIPTYTAYAALKADGSVVTWGDPSGGGDSSSVAAELSSGVSQIVASYGAFAAVKNDGSVVTWGNPNQGGDSSIVADFIGSGVAQVFSTGYAFAALKDDGSVVTWGSKEAGGDSSSVASRLMSNVQHIYSNHEAFAALKRDGSVVTWGRSDTGGQSSSVAADLSSGVIQIFSNEGAFAALKADGSVITWGLSGSGGDSSEVAERLQSGVLAFMDPFQDDRLLPELQAGSGSSSNPSESLILAIDTTAPLFTSDSTPIAIDENSGGSQVIYTASASDDNAVVYSLQSGNNDDAAVLSIDPATGEVKLTANPDYESQASYAFTVVATDAAGNASEQSVSVSINDLDELPTTSPMDFTGDGIIDPTDALLMMRHMMGTFPHDAITQGIPNIPDAEGLRHTIMSNMEQMNALEGGLRMDIDGDKIIKPLSDGLAIVWYIHGQGRLGGTPQVADLFENPIRGFDEMQNHLRGLVGF